MASKASMTSAEAGKAVDAVLESITTTSSGGEINFTGFGKFSTQHRKERQGVNPRNPSEKVTIPAATVPKFSAGSTLKQAVKSGGGGGDQRPRGTSEARPSRLLTVGARRRSAPSARPQRAVASERERRAGRRNLAVSRQAGRGGRAQAHASSSSGSTRGPTCSRSSSRRRAVRPRGDRGRRARASAAGSSTRSRRTSSPSSRSSRSSRRSAPTGSRAFEDVCALRARGRTARDRRREARRHRLDARAYAAAYLEPRGEAPPIADAMTVNPYLGRDSLEPFLAACRRDGAGLFCVVKTSNAGGADVQDLALSDGRPLWQQVAGLVHELGEDLVGEPRALERRRGRRRDASARGRRGAPAAAAGDPAAPGDRRAGRDAGRPRARVHERAGERARRARPAASSTPSARAARTGGRPRPARRLASGARSGPHRAGDGASVLIRSGRPVSSDGRAARPARPDVGTASGALDATRLEGRVQAVRGARGVPGRGDDRRAARPRRAAGRSRLRRRRAAATTAAVTTTTRSGRAHVPAVLRDPERRHARRRRAPLRHDRRRAARCSTPASSRTAHDRPARSACADLESPPREVPALVAVAATLAPRAAGPRRAAARDGAVPGWSRTAPPARCCCRSRPEARPDREHHEADDDPLDARAREARRRGHRQPSGGRGRRVLGRASTQGDRLTVRELLEAALIASANDAADALASLRRPRQPGALRRDDERQGPAARPARHALRQARRARRARPRLERARRHVAGAAADAPSDRAPDRAAADGDRSRAGASCAPGTTCSAAIPGSSASRRGTPTPRAGTRSRPRSADGVIDLRDAARQPDRSTRNADLAKLLDWGFSQYRQVAAVRKGATYATAEVGYGRRPVALVAARSLAPMARVERAARRRVVARTRPLCPCPGDSPWARPDLPARPSDRGRAAGRRPLGRTPGFGGRVDVVRGRDPPPHVGVGYVIVTVTMNAAIDRTLTVPNFQRGQRHRAVGRAHARRRQGDQHRARAEALRRPRRRHRARGRPAPARASSRS